jgi:hypothetical protein
MVTQGFTLGYHSLGFQPAQTARLHAGNAPMRSGEF